MKGAAWGLSSTSDTGFFAGNNVLLSMYIRKSMMKLRCMCRMYIWLN